MYLNSSLATLYDELTMPPELRKAHQQNDMAVMQAYGFTKGSEAYKSEAACIVRPAVLIPVLRNLNTGNTAKSVISYKGLFPLAVQVPILFIHQD